jgi:hypothetical protein
VVSGVRSGFRSRAGWFVFGSPWGAVACPYIYARAWVGEVGGGDGRQERENAARRPAPPAHPPGKEKLAGRLCTDVRVRHWGVEVEFEARPRAGTGPDRLSIGIYARLVV